MIQRELIYDPALTKEDLPDISRQNAAVFRLMSDGEWWTLQGLLKALAEMGISASETGVSTRVRDMRKKPISRIVERRSIGKRLFAYRMGEKVERP